jgi:hypothetical protein
MMELFQRDYNFISVRQTAKSKYLKQNFKDIANFFVSMNFLSIILLPT